ncbi:MAG: protein kinase [Ottowia sp.]|nr:protein kinase [Ottowia sp.]
MTRLHDIGRICPSNQFVTTTPLLNSEHAHHSVLSSLQIRHLIGTGAQGNVYELSDATNEKRYAGKTFHDRAALAVEQSAYSKLQGHQGIATCYGVVHLEGKEILITDFIGKDTLRNFISKCDDFCKRFHKEASYAPQMRLMLAQQLVDALHHIEKQGMCHADLKPENIMLSDDGKLKIIDLGLAVPRTSLISNMKGTHHYMAPEIILANNDFAKVDSYAMGNILLELLTGFRLKQNFSQFSLHNEKTAEDLHYAEYFEGGKTAQAGRSAPDLSQVLSASGSFFPTDKENPINASLRDQIIQPLQTLQADKRPTLAQIQTRIDNMANQYLDAWSLKEAKLLVEKINTHPSFTDERSGSRGSETVSEDTGFGQSAYSLSNHLSVQT